MVESFLAKEKKTPNWIFFSISFGNITKIQHDFLGDFNLKLLDGYFREFCSPVCTENNGKATSFHQCQITLAKNSHFPFVLSICLHFYDSSSLYSPCHFPIPSFSGVGPPLLLQFAGSTKRDKSVGHDFLTWCMLCCLLRCLVSSPYNSGSRLRTEVKTWCIVSLSSETRLVFYLFIHSSNKGIH